MNTIENYILALDGQQKAIISFLHRRFTDHHDLIGKIRYNIPFYYRKSWVCYLNTLKRNSVELVFTKGQELSNAQGLLSTNDRKIVAGVLLHDLNSIPGKAIDEMIQEALILDNI